MHKDAAAVRLALEGPIFVAIENWRRSQEKIPSRNEAIRRLIQRGLSADRARPRPARAPAAA